MNITDKYALFVSGEFSQWHRASFIIDGIKFNCNEQYMMYKKAILFGDHEIANEILNEPEPRYQKAMGRKVKNFNKDTWEAVCRDIVFRANFAKFTQNQYLYDLITDDKFKNVVFVEASDYDKIWGIGLSENDPRAFDESTWLGTNWLGQAITLVRDALVK